MIAKFLNTRAQRDSLFFIIILVYFCSCVFYNSFNHHDLFLNFDPLPDACEYAVVAANLLHGNGPYLIINETRLPSRYPMGYSVLLIPLLFLYGSSPESFSWAAMTIGSLAVFLFFTVARILFHGEYVPRFVTFLFASFPLLWVYSGLCTTEMASVMLVLFAAYAFLKIRDTDFARHYFLLGLSIGYASLVRLPNILLLVPVLWYLLFVHKSPARISRIFVLGFPLVVCIVVIAVQNLVLYGGVLHTGYTMHSMLNFSWESFQVNSLRYAKSILLGIDGSSIWINGAPYPVILPLLAWTGVFVLLRRRAYVFLVVSVGLFLLFFLFYSSWFYYDDRFFLPLVPLIFLAAGLGANDLFPPLDVRRFKIFALLVSCSFVLQPIAEGMSAWSSVWKGIGARYVPSNYVHVRSINAWMEQHGTRKDSTFLFTSVNLAYHDFFSNQRYRVLPVSHDQEYASLIGIRSPVDTCRALLEAGKEVYLSDYISTDGERHREALQLLKSSFRVEQVMEYLFGNARLYRLSLKNE